MYIVQQQLGIREKKVHLKQPTQADFDQHQSNELILDSTNS
jgi:hypothetical protein